ncbi:MAG: hypothetical protein KIS87_11670 [Phycisphaeraceae bacterium]|nr:hypothetical protein [Phycisphaeraceae bacterium]
MIASYRGTGEAFESDAKERFVYHAAGFRSSGSYIDDVVLRDRDAVQPEADPANTDPAETWLFESDGVLEERVFICQNWRADAALVVDSSGAAVQRAWYTAYGVPTGADRADLNGDGVVDSSDASVFSAWHGASDIRADWNLDGTINSTDTIAYLNAYNSAATLGGRGVLSSAALDLRVGYAGYRWEAFTERYHVRHRVYEPYLGVWQSRDPIRYHARTMNLYEFTSSNPIAFLDSHGLDIGRQGEDWGVRPQPKKPRPPKRNYELDPSDKHSPGIKKKNIHEIAEDLKEYCSQSQCNPCPRTTISTHGEPGVIDTGDIFITPQTLEDIRRMRDDDPTRQWPHYQDLDNSLKDIFEHSSEVEFFCCDAGAGDEGKKLADLLYDLYGKPVTLPRSTVRYLPGGIKWYDLPWNEPFSRKKERRGQ